MHESHGVGRGFLWFISIEIETGLNSDRFAFFFLLRSANTYGFMGTWTAILMMCRGV